MSDYSELKRLAEAANAYAEEDWHTPDRLFIAMERADAEFVSGCSPLSVLALIAENERLRLALKSAEDAMWEAESNMDNEAADIRDLLAAMDQGERSGG